jgi:TatD DNase family protein
MWIDSHCHLDHNKLQPAGGVEKIVSDANTAGVGGMVSINCRIVEEFPNLLTLVKPLHNVWCTIGTHPHEASRDDEKSVTLDDLIRMAKSNEKIVGIGESGLDYYYKNSTIENQHSSFRKHIQACIATDLPLIVHARDADDDVIRLIREETAGKGMRGVMHCFSSGPKMAEEALELGFYISFSGILTFKKSDELRDIAKRVPKDRLLVETDSPYLAPEPHRGSVNQPAYVAHTGAVLAGVHNISPEDMAVLTTANFFTLFNRAKLQ